MTAPTKHLPSLRIVSYSVTPVAGVPVILARCISARTHHRCRCVWATNRYGSGVVFDGDIQWTESPGQAEAELADADVVIVHNGKTDAMHAKLLAGKPIITMAHNYMWNVDPQFVQKEFPGVVVGQYQAVLPEFRGWAKVPNPIPLWEEAFQPDQKPDTVTICYTPSAKHETYPENHRLYWHSKGYYTTMRVLEMLVSRKGIRLNAIRDRQLPHSEALAMKRRSHIVIDECVTGSYHRNSLEGLASGCVVVNGVGPSSPVAPPLRYCAGYAAKVPFVYTNLFGLKRTLESLVEEGPHELCQAGQRNRQWMERYWEVGFQWERFWVPVVRRALDTAARRRSAATA